MTKYVRLAEEPLETNITLCEGLFVKHAIFAAGTMIAQHSHATDHLSVIATGAVRAWRGEELLGDFRAPAGIVIPARVKHRFLALEPMTTVLCVHRVSGDGGPEQHEANSLDFVEDA
jgi:quercetin dioxygenase-like cupin family protein